MIATDKYQSENYLVGNNLLYCTLFSNYQSPTEEIYQGGKGVSYITTPVGLMKQCKKASMSW